MIEKQNSRENVYRKTNGISYRLIEKSSNRSNSGTESKCFRLMSQANKSYLILNCGMIVRLQACGVFGWVGEGGLHYAENGKVLVFTNINA